MPAGVMVLVPIGGGVEEGRIAASHAPWTLVDSNDKKKARLNCITHILDQIPYEDLPEEKVDLGELQESKGFSDAMILKERTFVPEK